ncbi:MAG: D-alanyl-D-alanine carboxypeptidase family protein [Oscillospiraceae bacterium]
MTAVPQTEDVTPSPALQPTESEPGQEIGPETADAEETEPEPSGPPLPDIDLNDWMYKLVNRDHPLSRSFAPNVTELEGGKYFDSRAVEYLKEFIAAAREQGLEVYLSEGYRTYSAQEYIFNGKASQIYWGGGTYEEAVEKAKEIVAFPGTSEHQLGLAADIMDKKYTYKDPDVIGETETLKWMREHCAEYGFILRYPKDKEHITGFSYEPWHFRYVGKEAAAYIMETSICFEEFLELY